MVCIHDSVSHLWVDLASESPNRGRSAEDSSAHIASWCVGATFQPDCPGSEAVDSAAGLQPVVVETVRSHKGSQTNTPTHGHVRWDLVHQSGQSKPLAKEVGLYTQLSCCDTHSHKSTCWPPGTPLRQTFHLSSRQDRCQGECLDVGLVSDHSTECASGNCPQS